MKLLICVSYCLWRLYIDLYYLRRSGATIVSRGPDHEGVGLDPLVMTTHLVIVNKRPMPRGSRQLIVCKGLC
jgi:hypothetical protein